MNNMTIHKELWPNNGEIMLELSDYDLDFNEVYDQCRLFMNFIIIDTIHEDDLEWEKEYVTASLTLSATQEEYSHALNEQPEDFQLLSTLVFSLGNTDRVALVDAFDLVATKDGDYLEFKQNIYSSIRLSIFVNEEKTEVAFIGLLLEEQLLFTDFSRRRFNIQSKHKLEVKVGQ